jgi:hypothetical protein
MYYVFATRLTRKQSPNSQRCSQQREQEENTDRHHEEKSIAHLVRDSGCQLVAAPDPIANASRLDEKHQKREEVAEADLDHLLLHTSAPDVNSNIWRQGNQICLLMFLSF